jgi:3-methyladenine DNA glycosylase AlkC
MAEPLKNNFNAQLVGRFGQEIKNHFDKFPLFDFQESVINEQWEARELKDRMRHLTLCIHERLNLTYKKAVDVLLKVAPKFGGFEAMTFPDFVEVFGLDEASISLETLKKLTKYSSSEFAIRPYIIKNPKKVMDTMFGWSKDENEHVRRLASEGCRPRLPWAMALPEFKKEPAYIIPILENMIHDESLYVRKSVANNLNDITKDNPQIALEFAKKWYGKSNHANWIIKHGLRTLSKKGDPTALNILGFSGSPEIALINFKLSTENIKIGENISFEFGLENIAKKNAIVKVGFLVDYVKANGKTSKKIFHISEKSFEPSIVYKIKKKLSFKDLSTRKHYPGIHHISITINGNIIGTKNILVES